MHFSTRRFGLRSIQENDSTSTPENWLNESHGAKDTSNVNSPRYNIVKTNNGMSGTTKNSTHDSNNSVNSINLLTQVEI